jgi:hypothetical protein
MTERTILEELTVSVNQFDYNGKFLSQETLVFRKPKPNSDYTFDVYAGFRVNPNAYSIKLEYYNYYDIGFRPISNMRVPFCKNDFADYHKSNNMIYLCITFCGKRTIYEYHYGTLKCSHNKSSDSDEFKTFSISDIPREYRDALL